MTIDGAVIKNMDHLGLVAGMIDELQIVESIDKELPSSSQSKNISFGESVKAMILNGLGYTNKRLYLTPIFFKDKPLKKLFGREIEASWLNDDTLGRSLDKLFEYGVSELYFKIVQKALDVLKLTLSTIHLDSTSFHLDGKYANQETTIEDKNNEVREEQRVPIFITQGYSRDHHPELNQVVLNMITEHQAGIPLWIKPSDGNQVDTQAFANIVKEHINSMKRAFDTQIKVISDAALFTSKTIQEFKDNGMLFISRVPAKLKQAKEILKNYSEKEFVKLDENYQAITYTVEYEGVKQHWILYKSSHAKSREDKTIEKEGKRKQEQEKKLLAKLQRTAYYCEADANKAFKEQIDGMQTISIKSKKLITKPKYKTKGRPKPNTPPTHYEYCWEIETQPNEEYIKQQQDQKSGLFILATNDMTPLPQELLNEYKSQQRVERGFRFLKSPQFLSDAMFLKNPKRIEAMLMIMTLSLLVYSALEYKIRRELKAHNKAFANQLGKPVQNPTARWVFENFFAIHLLILSGYEQIVGLNEKHRLILELLGDSYMRFYGLVEDVNDKRKLNGKLGAE